MTSRGRHRGHVVPAQPHLAARFGRPHDPQVPGLRVEGRHRAIVQDRQGPRYVLPGRQDRLLTSRPGPGGDAVPGRPGLVVSHRALRPGCQQALPALATFARTSIGLHHIPLTCPFRARGTTGCDLDPSPVQVQLSCHPARSGLAAPTGHRTAAAHALSYRPCVASIGLDLATGPAQGRSPARLCADARRHSLRAPGRNRPGAFVMMGTRRTRWWW